MEAALSIADMGFQAYLVEKGDKLGGQAWNLVASSRGYDYRGYLEDLIKKVEKHTQHRGPVQLHRQGHQRLYRQLRPP